MKLSRHKLLPPAATILPALLSGFLFAASFPPLAIGPLIFIALAPLHAAVFKGSYSLSDTFRAGFLFGLTFFLLLLWWIKGLLPWANVSIPWLMTPALILLVLYLSLFPAFYFMLLNFLSRGKWLAALLAGPPLWVLLEIARSRGELGFPWGVLGYGLSYHTSFIQLASSIGLFGLSLLAMIVNVIFASIFLEHRLVRRLLILAAGGLIIWGNGMVGKSLMSRFERMEPEATITVAAVQPNIDLRVKWKPAFADSIFLLIEKLCRDISHYEPQIFIFPETSAPVYIRFETHYRARLSRLAKELNTPIFIGFLDAERDERDGEINIFNAAGLFSQEGDLVAQYEKVHLLPFGEALPLSARFHFLRRINFGQANFHPGLLGPPIALQTTSFGPLICFESIFPELSRHYTSRGAGFLVNITNDGWFGDTPGPLQHAQMCILRSVENRRTLVRSANTGLSMIVDPLGRITEYIELDRQGTMVETIPIYKEKTFYTRYGDLPLVLASILLIFTAFLVARRKI